MGEDKELQRLVKAAIAAFRRQQTVYLDHYLAVTSDHHPPPPDALMARGLALEKAMAGLEGWFSEQEASR